MSLDISRIEVGHEKTTQKPWYEDHGEIRTGPGPKGLVSLAFVRSEDIDFCVSAHEDVPALCAELRRQENEIWELQKDVNYEILERKGIEKENERYKTAIKEAIKQTPPIVDDATCPVCRANLDDESHYEDCWLGILLKAFEGDK